jgi:hypothetical protein
MGVRLFILSLCAVYCFAVLFFTRRLPTWLRQLVCTFLLALVWPVFVVHEGGAARAPAIICLTVGLGDLELGDVRGLAIQIAPVWIAAYCVWMIGVGVRHLIRKKTSHAT